MLLVILNELNEIRSYWCNITERTLLYASVYFSCRDLSKPYLNSWKRNKENNGRLKGFSDNFLPRKWTLKRLTVQYHWKKSARCQQRLLWFIGQELSWLRQSRTKTEKLMVWFDVSSACRDFLVWRYRKWQSRTETGKRSFRMSSFTKITAIFFSMRILNEQHPKILFGSFHLHDITLLGFIDEVKSLIYTGFMSWGFTVTLEERGSRMSIITEVLCFV